MGNQQPTSICYLSFEQCLCGRLYVGFEKEKSERYLGSFTDTSFKPTKKLTLYETTEPIMALFVEDMFQRCWETRKNKRFANQQKGGFQHQVNFILDTKHGGNKHTDETREKISNTMVEKQLGTAKESVRQAAWESNRGKKRTVEQKLRIQAGTAMSHLKRRRFSNSPAPLTTEDKEKLCSIIEEAQRLGVYSVPASARETWESLKRDKI